MSDQATAAWPKRSPLAIADSLSNSARLVTLEVPILLHQARTDLGELLLGRAIWFE
jgi:hypothetical protein